MVDRKEIDPFQYRDYFERNTALMVSMDKNDKTNVMALDWKELQKREEKPVIRAQVAYSRYTYTFLTEGIPEFTINIPSKKIADAVDVAGFYSGRDVDKFKKANLKTIAGKVTKVPTLRDCLLNYECKIIDEEKSNMSSHHYFYGEILVAYASTELGK